MFANLWQTVRRSPERLRRAERRDEAAEEAAARQAKIDALQPQLERKLSELKARYRLKVELAPVAALRLAIRIRQVTVNGPGARLATSPR